MVTVDDRMRCLSNIISWKAHLGDELLGESVPFDLLVLSASLTDPEEELGVRVQDENVL